MGLIRRYTKDDDRTLKNMLLLEGIAKDRMNYKNSNVDTFVYVDNGVIKGFFTIKQEHKMPSLQHFIVEKKYRSARIARELVRMFETILKVNRLRRSIVHAKEDYLRILIEYYWKTKPYAIKDGRAWYIVEV